jgi:hypothetical protein
MDVDLTEEEFTNLILVTIDQLQQNLPYPENGVELKFLASNLGKKLDEVKECIQKLKAQKTVSWRFDQTRELFFVNPTAETLENFEKLNALSLSETSNIILKKSYDFYRRAGHDSSIQLSSSIIGSVIGLNNISKINSAVEMLLDKGLIKNPAIMRDNTIYFLSAKGIDMIENEPEKQAESGDYISLSNITGNVAIHSSHVNQTVNNNESVAGYFEILEKLITENLKGKEKTDAIDDLETIKELAKVETPRKHLIQRVLNNLDKIPALFEIADKIRNYFS